MKACVDVDYRDDHAVAACVLFRDWGDAEPADTLVVRVGWSGDGRRAVYEVQDRVQSWLDLNAADPATGRSSKLLREESM